MMNQHPNLPSISIVTPSYNQGQFLEETIQSVLNQNYPNLEYIIIDGGSTDNSVKIIRKYEDRLAYWVSEKDRGQTEAINKGFKIATGELIAWINSDDYYCENVFFRIAAFFSANPEIMLIYGNSYFVDEKGKITAFKPALPFNAFIIRHGGFLIHQPTVFLRRTVLKDVGYLNDSYHGVMDIEWYCRISERYKPVPLNIDVAMFRWHQASKSSSPSGSNHYLRSLNERISVTVKYSPILKPFFRLAPIITNELLVNISRCIKMYYRIKLVFEKHWIKNDKKGK
jgi:glycosyltransferase involved in cell wall biosynthesis